MMSRFFTWFPIGGLGKPNYIIIWLNLQEGGKILEAVWLWRISGGAISTKKAVSSKAIQLIYGSKGDMSRRKNAQRKARKNR